MGGRGSGRKRTDPADRFWSYVNIPEDQSDCWEWAGATVSPRDSTGVFWDGYKSVRVNRFVYELIFGKIPTGGRVYKTCQNQRCVHPDHMKLKTTA